MKFSCSIYCLLSQKISVNCKYLIFFFFGALAWVEWREERKSLNFPSRSCVPPREHVCSHPRGSSKSLSAKVCHFFVAEKNFCCFLLGGSQQVRMGSLTKGFSREICRVPNVIDHELRDFIFCTMRKKFSVAIRYFSLQTHHWIVSEIGISRIHVNPCRIR